LNFGKLFLSCVNAEFTVQRQNNKTIKKKEIKNWLVDGQFNQINDVY
jgi:hypothetical protein